MYSNSITLGGPILDQRSYFASFLNWAVYKHIDCQYYVPHICLCKMAHWSCDMST